MDDIDRAQQDMEFLSSIKREPPKMEAEPVGKCLFCGKPLNDPKRRWCDAECRDNWELETKEKRNVFK